MTETTWAALRQLLADRYDDFRSQLTRRLGSAELARETLHETYLHLDRAEPPGSIRSPKAFLLRVAFNIAADRGRADRRRAKKHEVEAFLAESLVESLTELVPDQAPRPDQVVEARLELESLEAALEELTDRRRMILLWSRLEDVPLREIAGRLGISQRLVEIELKHAVEHCAERLDRTVTQRFGPRPRETSKTQACP